MKLKSKTLVITIFTNIALVIVLYFTIRNFLVKSFTDLEENSTKQLLKGVLNVYNLSISNFSSKFNSWIEWDNSHPYVLTKLETPVDSITAVKTFKSLGVNVIVSVDTASKLIWYGTYDSKSGYKKEIPREIREKIKDSKGNTDRFLFPNKNSRDRVVGILPVNSQPMVISTKSIITVTEGKDAKEEKTGNIITGFYLNSDRIKALSEATQSSIEIEFFNSKTLKPDFIKAKRELSSGFPVSLHALNDTTFAAYAILKDVYFRSAFIIKVKNNREFYTQELFSINYLIISILIVIAVSTVIIIVAFQFGVIEKITNLNKNVLRIARSNNSVLRLKIEGDDEVAMLSSEINSLLEGNVKSGKALIESQTQLFQTEKMATLGQMVAGLAHEINTPLGFVRGNIELIQRNVEFVINSLNKHKTLRELIENGDISTIEQHLSEASESYKKIDDFQLIPKTTEIVSDTFTGLERIQELVLNLKDFSRLDSGEFHYADINKSLDSSLMIAQNVLKGKVTVEKNYAPKLIIECYPAQINQVFLNLITNAAQAIEGSGVITITTEIGKNNNAIIKIGDSGKGIKEEQLNKIFDPFFTTKPIGQGTGLGLTIVQQIIALHKGEISVKSEIGKGTEFTIVLPLVHRSY